MRVEVTSQPADTELVVVAPNGTVFRDDDSGQGSEPLVRIPNTPNNGWYTVQLNHFAGAAIEGNFVLRYGRYTRSNANCQPGTAPRLAAEVLDSEKAVSFEAEEARLEGAHPGE